MSMLSLHAHTPVLVLKSIFKAFDKDNNQQLDKQEFTELLSELGITLKEQRDACQLLADENADGVVSLEEFVDWVQKDEIMDIILDNNKFRMLFSVCNKFKSVDTDDNKTITWDEFRDFFVDGETFDIDVAKEFWNAIDVNCDGVITFKEYWNHTKRMSGAFDKTKKKRTSTNKYNMNLISKPKYDESKFDEETEKESNIIEQLVIFGYDEFDIREAMENVIDKYNINEIQTYLDKKEDDKQICMYMSIEEARKLKGANRETLISDADFEKVFGMNRTKFKELKGWKQKQLKKKTGFF